MFKTRRIIIYSALLFDLSKTGFRLPLSSLDMSPKSNSQPPSRKKQPFNKRRTKNSEKENCNADNVNKFRDLLGKKWKVYRVSPLFNFSRDKLKFYETKLNEDLNSKRTGASICYKCKFTLNKSLRLNDECAEGIQVVIIKNDSQTIYTGNLMSGSNRKLDSKVAIFLPILLVEGKLRETDIVHSSLCKLFDCDIQPVTFSSCALITFLVKLLETPRNGVDVSQEHIIMDYKVPECAVNDRITISLVLESTVIAFAAVMDNLNEKFPGITTMQIIWEFYNKMLNHVFHIYKLDLNFAELQKIAFPDAFLTSDGQLKMFTVGAAISTLNVLEYFTPLDAVLSIN